MHVVHAIFNCLLGFVERRRGMAQTAHCLSHMDPVKQKRRGSTKHDTTKTNTWVICTLHWLDFAGWQHLLGFLSLEPWNHSEWMPGGSGLCKQASKLCMRCMGWLAIVDLGGFEDPEIEGASLLLCYSLSLCISVQRHVLGMGQNHVSQSFCTKNRIE